MKILLVLLLPLLLTISCNALFFLPCFWQSFGQLSRCWPYLNGALNVNGQRFSFGSASQPEYDKQYYSEQEYPSQRSNVYQLVQKGFADFATQLNRVLASAGSNLGFLGRNQYPQRVYFNPLPNYRVSPSDGSNLGASQTRRVYVRALPTFNPIQFRQNGYSNIVLQNGIPVQYVTPNVNAIENVSPNVNTIQYVSPNVIPLQNVSPNVNTIQNVSPAVDSVQNVANVGVTNEVQTKQTDEPYPNADSISIQTPNLGMLSGFIPPKVNVKAGFSGGIYLRLTNHSKETYGAIISGAHNANFDISQPEPPPYDPTPIEQPPVVQPNVEHNPIVVPPT